MKKIITLAIALGAFAATNAQTTRDESRRVILGDGGNTSTKGKSGDTRDIILGGDTRSYPNSESAEADRINRTYDAKINSIRNNRSLSETEKQRIIRDLENERARKLRALNDGSGVRKNKGDNCDKKSKNKSNKGKHLGWEKGKGNKHGDNDRD